MKYPQLTNDPAAFKLKAVTERDDERKVTDGLYLRLFGLLFFFCSHFQGYSSRAEVSSRSDSKESNKKEPQL